MIAGGWEYVWTSYGIVWATVLVYVLYLAGKQSGAGANGAAAIDNTPPAIDPSAPTGKGAAR